MFNWIRNKTKSAWNWVKSKTKKILIGLGIIGVAMAIGTTTQNGEILCKDDTTKTINERISVCPIPVNERASFKGREIAKIKSVAKVNRGKYEIEITEIKAIDGGIEFLARAWKNGKQIGFGKDGSVEWERFRIINPPILVDDPNGNIVRKWVDDITGKRKQRKLREDPTEAILQSLEHTISIKKQKFLNGKIVPGKVGSTTLTVYPEPGTGTAPVDGNIYRGTGSGSVNDSYTNINNGAGTGVRLSEATDYIMLLQTHNVSSPNFSGMRRFGVGFDTSSIGSDNVDSATLSLYGSDSNTGLGDPDLEIVSFSPGDGSAYVAGDFSNFGSTAFSTGLAVSSFNTSAYNNFTLNSSGKSNINKNGNTYYGVRTNWQLADSFGGSWASASLTLAVSYQADETGTTKDPKLVVEHSAAVAAPAPVPDVIWFQ